MCQSISAKFVHLGRRFAGRDVGIHVEPGVAQPVQKLMLAVNVQRCRIGNSVNKGREVALGRNLGIFLAKAARRRVSGVGKRIASLGIGFVVQSHETALGHIDLTADLDHAVTVGAHVCQGFLRKMHGDVLNRADIQRDILAGRAVAASSSAHKSAVLIGNGYAQTVDLELARIRHAAGAQGVFRALEPSVELLEIHGIVHGIHARHVRDGGKLVRDVAAHALRI